jgi:hypothetical protein
MGKQCENVIISKCDNEMPNDRLWSVEMLSPYASLAIIDLGTSKSALFDILATLRSTTSHRCYKKSRIAATR